MGKYIVTLLLAITTCGQISNHVSTVELQQENVLVIKVNDEYYYSEGKESELYGRCGVMDGKITSTVEATELPSENDQSNFGLDYGYQYANGAIEVNIDGKWIVFEKQNNNGTN